MLRKLASIESYAGLIVFIACGSVKALGQECPRYNPTGPTTPSQTQTVEGRLIFHNEMRGFFELKLNHPQCGQASIQLIDTKSKALELFRGCRVKSTGVIDISGTGYFSRDQFQDVEKIEPVGICARQPLFPDYSNAKPSKAIREYRVDMHLNYRPGDHPIKFHVKSGRKVLRPWQTYASYDLTGEFVLYGRCADGFVVDKVFGTPQAHPFHFDVPRTPSDMASFDPESAAAAGTRDLNLGYTCVRNE
jgi:hypothetical protein